jgi:hypothetical protein
MCAPDEDLTLMDFAIAAFQKEASFINHSVH